MIKLINGFEVEYSDDFDRFFQNLLEAVIRVSRLSAVKKKAIKDDIRLEQNKMYQTGAGKSYISRAKSYQMDRASFFGPFASLHAGH